MVLHEPLDLQYWLVNVFSGSWEIALLVLLFGFAFLAAKLRLPDEVFFTLMALFSVFVYAYLPWYFLLSIIIGGSAIFITFARLLNK